MVELTPHDSGALSRLAQFPRLALDRREAILGEIQAQDARQVGEVLLDPSKYQAAPSQVRATVDRFNAWLKANRRLGKQRASRRVAARARRSASRSVHP
jgi:hypothetical protein